MIIICGLGNPGAKYTKTRHNIGFRLVDKLANGKAFLEKWNALILKTELHGKQVLLLKPQTYMNLSGQALRQVVNFYKIKPENIVITYDDVDLKFGDIRYRKEGSAGTHNGMKSVIRELGTNKIPRLRLGVESRGLYMPEQMDLANFVLAPFAKEEEQQMESFLAKASEELKNHLP